MLNSSDIVSARCWRGIREWRGRGGFEWTDRDNNRSNSGKSGSVRRGSLIDDYKSDNCKSDGGASTSRLGNQSAEINSESERDRSRVEFLWRWLSSHLLARSCIIACAYSGGCFANEISRARVFSARPLLHGKEPLRSRGKMLGEGCLNGSSCESSVPSSPATGSGEDAHFSNLSGGKTPCRLAWTAAGPTETLPAIARGDVAQVKAIHHGVLLGVEHSVTATKMKEYQTFERLYYSSVAGNFLLSSVDEVKRFCYSVAKARRVDCLRLCRTGVSEFLLIDC